MHCKRRLSLFTKDNEHSLKEKGTYHKNEEHSIIFGMDRL